jgi:HK97 gp10 family phage protein
MAMRAKIKPQSRDAVMKRLRELAPEAEKSASDAIQKGAQELAGAIRSRAPRDQGDFEGSIQADKLSNRPDKKAVGITETKDPNAWGIFAKWTWRFLEFGTRPHIIKAKNKPNLVFYVGGKKVVTEKVAHPGSKAKNFIFPTYREYKKRIRRRVANAINKSIRAAQSSQVDSDE